MIGLPDTESSECIADWVELNLALQKNTLSKSDIESLIETNTGDDVKESFLSDVWRELEYRNSLYLDNFFYIDDRSIQWIFQSNPPNEYIMCLFLSIFGVQGNTQTPGKIFEKITKYAVEKYLTGKAEVFGWPFEPIDGNEESAIKQKIKQLSTSLNERFIESPPSHFKDRGLDVVGWIPHFDNRSSQVVLLVQCAAGHNWSDKQPVPIENWKQYLHWGVHPITAFAVPCIIKERDWHEKSVEKGLLFDRIRLINLLNSGINDILLEEDLNTWIQEQINIYQN
ncbi:MAG: hypothetical protein C0410_03700 [Anaerolinea sp.]|nr:hypothetical protein [Anaerolinea sp.]